MLKSNLLATKLHHPTLPTKWIQRPHLSQRLHEGFAHNRQVTLISAPAGFGKTTCISEWVHTLDRWPVTWLSLDAADNDPRRFFAYLIAALQKVDTTLGQEIAGVMRAGQMPPCEIISTTLINDILTVNGRFLLILDDFQVIQDPFILQLFEQLITNLPPPLHLVLLTREDPPLPLARLRANIQLTEIRARDLRFSHHDTNRFLNEVMGLSLSQTDTTTLANKTEGWIVGLQLAGLSVRDRANPTSFIATLSGSHRFILSYLTEQVLNQQPPEIQQFLLQTAVLDKLHGDLCNAVTGRADSHILLERLLHANLFLIPLDDEQQWYRYHHLFADLLRGLQNAQQQAETAVLHQRASHWYAQAGMTSEAIQHALAAEAYALAVDLLESHAMSMIMQGYAKTVNSWVQAVPTKWRSQSPKTNLAFAWMHLLRGAYAEVAPYLQRLPAALADDPANAQVRPEHASLTADWLVIQSLMLYKQGQTAQSMDTANRALAIAPESDSRVRSLAFYALASGFQLKEGYAQAVTAYQLSIQHSRAAENLVAEMMSTVGLVLMAFEQGQLQLAYEIAAPVIMRIEQSGVLPPISAVVSGVLADIYYQWHQLKQARHYLLHTLHLSTLGGYNTGTIFCQVLLSRLSHSEGNLEAAADEIQKASSLLPVEVPDYVRQEVVAQQVCIHLARNRPAAAEMALQGEGYSFRDGFSFPDFPSDQSTPHAMGLLYNSSLRVLLYQGRAGHNLVNLTSGIALATRLIAGAFPGQQFLITLEALLLRAQMHAALGNSPSNLAASQADYVSALELAAPEGFIGVFVEQGPPVAEALAKLVKQNQLRTVQPDYVARILAAFSSSQSAGTTHDDPNLPAGNGTEALIEPLTDRELDVLRLMTEGLKYKEIATRLFISLNTVRSHTKAIYGKLHVNNRTQAIEMARQRRIL